MFKFKNRYFLLRHGHSLRNAKKIASSWPEKIPLPLTLKGKEQIKKAAKKLKKEKIDFIFSSDILRTKQTAEIVAGQIGVKPRFDKRLREINVGILNGCSVEEVGRFWDKEKKLSPKKYYLKRFKLSPPKGENYNEVEKRMLDFICQKEKKYQGKNILIVSHQRPITLLEKKIYGYDFKKFIKIIIEKKQIKTGEIRKL